MKVACIQLTSGENYNKNVKNIILYIKKSISNNADLIITPEVSSLITKNKNLLDKFTFKMSEDPLLHKIKLISKKYKKWILIGSIISKSGNKLKNRSIVVNPSGKIIKYYDKINMFDVKLNKNEIYKESKTYSSGNKLVSVKLPWGNLGLTICYDLRFPELFRKLSKKKLKFISVPSAFTKITGKKHWITLLRARAIENFCYIFAPAQYGRNTKTRETYGHSVIISPDGKVLKIKKKGTGVIYCNIDTNLSMKLRKAIPSMI